MQSPVINAIGNDIETISKRRRFRTFDIVSISFRMAFLTGHGGSTLRPATTAILSDMRTVQKLNSCGQSRTTSAVWPGQARPGRYSFHSEPLLCRAERHDHRWTIQCIGCDLKEPKTKIHVVHIRQRSNSGSFLLFTARNDKRYTVFTYFQRYF